MSYIERMIECLESNLMKLREELNRNQDKDRQYKSRIHQECGCLSFCFFAELSTLQEIWGEGRKRADCFLSDGDF